MTNTENPHPEAGEHGNNATANGTEPNDQSGFVAQALKLGLLPAMLALTGRQFPKTFCRPQHKAHGKLSHFRRICTRTVGNERTLSSHGVIKTAVRTGVFGMRPAWLRELYHGVDECFAIRIAG